MKNVVCTLSILIGLIAIWVYGEIQYSARVQPVGVRTVKDHVKRFGSPQFVFSVMHDGVTAYELQGFPGGSRPLLSFPSSAPVYVYDGNGQLIDWCADPGDDSRHREKWPKLSNTPLDDNDAFRRRFNL